MPPTPLDVPSSRGLPLLLHGNRLDGSGCEALKRGAGGESDRHEVLMELDVVRIDQVERLNRFSVGEQPWLAHTSAAAERIRLEDVVRERAVVTSGIARPHQQGDPAIAVILDETDQLIDCRGVCAACAAPKP